MAIVTVYTGAACGCRRGIERDNCSACEGTGRAIDFAAIRRAACIELGHAWAAGRGNVETCGRCGKWRGTGEPIIEVRA
jgi:hypothetical protein